MKQSTVYFKLSLIMVNAKGLTMCHVNIRGLNDNSLAAIKANLSGVYDIITLSETFLSANTGNVSLDIPGYHEVIRKDRPTFGGGVALYIQSNLSYVRRIEYERTDLESIWVSVNTCDGQVLLCTVYRPPSCFSFWEAFEENIDTIKSTPGAKHLVILGDLNADPGTVMGRNLQNICSTHNICCLIDKPTRYTATSQSCLDQIITNMPNFVVRTEVLPPVYVNDHCTVTAELRFKLPIEEAYDRYVWLYKDADFDGFREYLANYNWDECFVPDDVEQTSRKWTETFLNIARMFVPNKVVKVRPNDKPWFNSELRRLRRKVHRAHKKLNVGPTDQNYKAKWDDYVSIRKKYKDSLKEASKKYNEQLNRTLSQSGVNEKKWWSTVNTILGRAGDDSIPPILDPSTGCYAKTSKDKAEIFNKFFLSHTTVTADGSDLPFESEQGTSCSLCEISVSVEDVLDQVKAISTNKATGPDNLSAKLLKEAGASIAPVLARLFNMSLRSNIMPKCWKRANVIPIHKKDSKQSASNYRPISLLPVISKVFEKVVFKYVYNYLHRNSLISYHQSGFKPKDSTINQLAYLYHTFSKALDDKKDVRIIFCDVSKAFDRVWHRGLIYKLNRIGVSGSLLSWFESYLSDRSQRVVIKGQCSEWGEIEAGVPQGSVLGPLLFLVYINDLIEAVDCDIKLFADDTTLYISVDDHKVASDTLNRNLCNVKVWANRWLVNFNPEKTESLVVTNKKKESYPPVLYNNEPIREVDSHKHLGLTFNSKLSWSQHIGSLVARIAKLKDVMLYLKNRLDRYTLNNIYITFVRPKLEYACIIWADCTNRDKVMLERCQLSFARIVTGARKGTKTELLYDEVGWPRLEERRQQSTLIYFHKLVHGNAPDYVCSLLPEANNSSSYNLRQSNALPPVRARTEKFNNTLIVNGIKLWNSLPPNVQELHELSEFKKAICVKCDKNPLYLVGSRKLQITHAQIRMNCSLLAAHLYGLHVKDSPNCHICNVKEDSKHYFLECKIFLRQREVLKNTLNPLNSFNMTCILYGNSNLPYDTNLLIFKAVHYYIECTKRFDI